MIEAIKKKLKEDLQIAKNASSKFDLEYWNDVYNPGKDETFVQEVRLIDGDKQDKKFIEHCRDVFESRVRALEIAVGSLEKVKHHGCCVMHSDSQCPGCEATDSLKQIAIELEVAE